MTTDLEANKFIKEKNYTHFGSKTIVITCFFLVTLSACMEKGEGRFAAIEFDLSFDSYEHDICNSVQVPIYMRVTNTFSEPVGIIKHAEKESNCLEYESVIHYEIDDDGKAIGYSRGLSNFNPPETIDTLSVGVSKLYVIDSLAFYYRLLVDTNVSISQYFYSYKELTVDGDEKAFSVLVYLSPDKEPMQSFIEVKEKAFIPFQTYNSQSFD